MKVFISYEHNVWPLAKTISDWLSPRHDVYWDFKNLNPGMLFNEKISSLIADSDLIIFLGSLSALSSKWVSAELAYSKALQKTIIPIKLEGVDNGQIEAMPFIGKVHVLDWPTGKDVSSEVLEAIANSAYSDSIEIELLKLGNDMLVMNYKNKMPIDFYDVHFNVNVEFKDPAGGTLFSPIVNRHFLTLPRHSKGWARFEIAEFSKLKERQDGFFSSGFVFVVLCKYCFQNQERYFYLTKRIKVDESLRSAE